MSKKKKNSRNAYKLPIRLPRGSRWKKSQDAQGRTVISQAGEMDSTQFWGGLIFLAFFGCMFLGLLLNLISRIPSSKNWTCAYFEQNTEIFAVAYYLIPIGIIAVASGAYFFHEIRKAFEIRSWTFDKREAICNTKIGYLSRTVRYDLRTLRRFDIRPYRSWHDQFNMDYDSRLGLTFQNNQAAPLARILKLTLSEAKWIIQLCKPIYWLPEDVDKTGNISILLRGIRVPRSFVCTETQLRFTLRYMQWRCWPLWIMFSLAVPLAVLSCIVWSDWIWMRPSCGEFADSLSNNFLLTLLPCIPWILAIPLFGLVLYSFLGKESGKLDSKGFTYTMSVIVPLYYRFIPIEDLISFSIAPVGNNFITGIAVLARNRKPFTFLHISSLEPHCDIHDWIKRHGNRVIKNLQGHIFDS